MISATHSQLPQTEYNPLMEHTASQDAPVLFIDLGTKLLSQGKHDEAMAMFDASIHSVASLSNDALSAQLKWGSQQLVHTDAVAFVQPPVDTYHEDECDVGPRPFSTALVPSVSTDFETLQMIICYNKALVHHAKNEFPAALQLYNIIVGAITRTLAKNEAASSDFLNIAMRVYNNMGQISYAERSENSAMMQFETALMFANRVKDASDTHALDYANIMSNWCRVQWMLGDACPKVHEALEEILRIRSLILGWDHIDVASAHYNVGMAE